MAARPCGTAAVPVLDALTDSAYRRLFLGSLCANTARWLDVLTLGWVALQLTGSPLMVGVAGFARAAPMMVLGPVAGLAADRLPRVRLMAAVQAVNAGVALALAALFATGRADFATLVTLEMVLGAAWALDFPPRRTLVSSLMGPRRLTNAISLDSVSMQVSKMAGPVVAGLLLGGPGPAACYLVLAILSLCALGATLALARRVPPETPGPPQPLAPSLASGLREALERPPIRAVLVVTLVMNGLVFPYQHLLAVFARNVLQVGPEGLGLLAAAQGLGALVGSLLVAGRRGFAHHRQLFAGSSLAGAVLVLAFALSPWYALSLALQLMYGLAESGFGTMQSTIVLLATPEAARGRVMGILSACIGTQPLGTLWLGFLAGQAGARPATAAGAALAVALMAPLAGRLGLRADGVPFPVGGPEVRS